MITLKKITTHSVALCLAVTLMSSCSNHNKDSKDVAEEANQENLNGKAEKGAEHLVEAYSGNLYEIKASENAALNASTPEVKKIATMMIEAHTKMNGDVQMLANSKQVALPSDLSDDQRKSLEKLTDKTGLEYDKAYISDMKSKHEDALKMLEKISEKCDDAEIKTWANNTLPEVASHLEMVKSTENILKDKK